MLLLNSAAQELSYHQQYQYGLPEELVSDNSPQFTSTEFAEFLKGNQIKHIMSAPYHLAFNGLAERFVQTMKWTLKASMKQGKSINHRLAEFLFEYRATPHGTTNVSPSELFLKRNLRKRFNLMIPNTKGHLTAKQADQKLQHDKQTQLLSLFLGSSCSNGQILLRTVKQHVDQLRLRDSNPETSSVTQEGANVLENHHNLSPESDLPSQAIQNPAVSERHYPQHERRPPDRFVPNSNGQ